MREEGDTRDVRVAAIAKRQHGVVSQAQLLTSGLSTSAISRRVGVGRLHRVHRGVYAVGHSGLSPHARWMAAALASGVGAVVSHRSAAELWGLLNPVDGLVDVSIPGTQGRRKRRGIRLHRCRSLIANDVTRRSGIPVTTPSRTLADLRRALPDRQRRRAVRQAEILGLAIDSGQRIYRTRSDLELAFLTLCERHRLPTPEVNARVGRWRADFLWREAKVVVETDGYRYHRGRQGFEDDRARDLDLRARGLEVIRLSERQVDDEPERVAAVLRAVLDSQPAP